jgi:predicted Zn-dependent protease
MTTNLLRARAGWVRALVLLCLVAAVGCGGAGEGPGKRPQHLALTPEQEYDLGVHAYREILKKSQVVPDGPEVERVRRVGRKIAEATGIEPLMREMNLRLKGYRFGWEFNVLRDRQINAFCLSGGKVAVYTGLLPVAANDNQLATVMAHEIAHALAHHTSERIARAQLEEQAVQMAGGLFGQMDPHQRELLLKVLAGGAHVAGLSYDRQQESEADHIGVFLMTFAGYDPDQAVAFWERMEQASHGRSPPEILSTHPSNARRIAQLRAWVPQARAAKRAYDSGDIAR